MQGTVANFVETEQILELKPHSSSKAPVVCSFVQIRGSIPLLWSQIPNVKYKPPTRMSPTAATEPAFDAHVRDLLESYKVRLSACSCEGWRLSKQPCEKCVVRCSDDVLPECSMIGPRHQADRQPLLKSVRVHVLTGFFSCRLFWL